MKSIHWTLGRLLACACLLWLPVRAAAQSTEPPTEVRPAVLAGTWYAGSPSALSQNIRGLLDGVGTRQVDGALVGLVVPHAGHTYSGRVAAHAYRLIENLPIRRVVLIGPSHRVGFQGVAADLRKGYETPLGVVPLDQRTARKLMDGCPEIRWLPRVHDSEHSLEIQLPFLQTVLPRAEIVPLVMGQQDLATCALLAERLRAVLGTGGETLIVASTDLSHYHSSAQARVLDMRIVGRIERLDPEGLSEDLRSGACEACGGGPVITVLLAGKAMGADKAVILNYADSGDVTGDHRRVVGYAAAAVLKSSDKDPRPR